MKYVILGGSGFIGSALTRFWLEQGHEVVIITRKSKLGDRALTDVQKPLLYYTWHDIEQNPLLLRGAEGIVNLAGATINQRWTRKGKQAIIDSRLSTTQALGRWLSVLGNEGPKVIVQGSAVGIYGTSLTQEFTEHSSCVHPDFLSEVTAAWEKTAQQSIQTATRLVLLRTGVVLGNQGGAYPLMRLPFLLGVGGRIGTGKQWVPWIHIGDLVSLIDFCIAHPEISGPVNAVSPNPMTNEQFGHTIGRVHHRPFWLPLPAFVLRAILGEMSLLLLEGQQVVPQAAISSGFKYTYPQLEEAVANLKDQKRH
ncbi:TIGR01777 family oxidoreductase [Paenibacillus aceti]|uniref:Epimerase n=1 Tax=Paenibacillus aceti TaxID=1820010 RepID=A0ABQ1W7C6_9BACL|nr:TIGR01777 family oxidoreductase [Paenibacillus aceti]GGG18832.1 epimerase [Paenibacillus aceti]